MLRVLSKIFLISLLFFTEVDVHFSLKENFELSHNLRMFRMHLNINMELKYLLNIMKDEMLNLKSNWAEISEESHRDIKELFQEVLEHMADTSGHFTFGCNRIEISKNMGKFQDNHELLNNLLRNQTKTNVIELLEKWKELKPVMQNYTQEAKKLITNNHQLLGRWSNTSTSIQLIKKSKDVRNCQEALKLSNRTEGVYLMKMSSFRIEKFSFPVFCKSYESDMLKDLTLIAIINCNVKKYPPVRPLLDFHHGYGSLTNHSLSNEYFIGIERVKDLTYDRSQMLIVHVTLHKIPEITFTVNNPMIFIYNHFYVRNNMLTLNFTSTNNERSHPKHHRIEKDVRYYFSCDRIGWQQPNFHKHFFSVHSKRKFKKVEPKMTVAMYLRSMA